MMAARAESSTAGSGKAKAVQDSAASAGYELPWYVLSSQKLTQGGKIPTDGFR
jgi:hypothetical protein